MSTVSESVLSYEWLYKAQSGELRPAQDKPHYYYHYHSFLSFLSFFFLSTCCKLELSGKRRAQLKRKVSIRLSCRQVCEGIFLITGWCERAQSRVGSATSGQVVLRAIRKVSERDLESRQCSLRRLLRSCPDGPHERKLLLVSVFVSENKTCSDAIRSGPPSCSSQTVGRSAENKTGISGSQG